MYYRLHGGETKITDSSPVKDWINEVVEDINELVLRVALAKNMKQYLSVILGI
jgi:hypothetical protein